MNQRLYQLRSANNRLFEVLEELGRNAPNLGDIAERLRQNNADIKTIEQQLLTMEGEPDDIELAPIHVDVVELIDFLDDVIKKATSPKRLRAFFQAFVEEIVIHDAQAILKYTPEVLVLSAGAVHNRSVPPLRWLPGTRLLRTAAISLELPPRLAKAG